MSDEVATAISVVKDFYHTINGATSLYLRGSAVSNYATRFHKPWDIDFVIALPKAAFNKKQFEQFIWQSNEARRPNPPIDIRFIHHENMNDIRYLHTLLLIKHGSQRIAGNIINLSHTEKIKFGQRVEILDLYLSKVDSRLTELENMTFDRTVAKEKSKRLAKALARAANMFKYAETSIFDRTPATGILEIEKICGKLSSSFLLEAIEGRELIRIKHSRKLYLMLQHSRSHIHA